MKKTNTTQMKNAFRSYQMSEARLLRDVYTTWSDEKQKAFNHCFDVYNQYNGTQYRIIGANTFSFSFGFIGYVDGKKAFFYITASNERYMYID